MLGVPGIPEQSSAVFFHEALLWEYLDHPCGGLFFGLHKVMLLSV
jgi:hypothetical protein